MDRFGTPNQRDYALSLGTELGLADLRAAIAAVTGSPVPEGEEINLSTQEASGVITGLIKQYDARFPGRRAAMKANGKSGRDSPPDLKAAPRGATSRQIRRWAQGHDTFDESELDQDTHWILTRLVQYELVLAATRTKDALKGRVSDRAAVNGNDPIRVEQLLAFFEGSEEEAAKAMDVSVTTLRAWGTYVPPQRSWQAEVMTHGRVRAPRRSIDADAVKS